jgi:hypothetical protein
MNLLYKNVSLVLVCHRSAGNEPGVATKPSFIMRSMESFGNADNSLLSIKRTSLEKYYFNITVTTNMFYAVNF